MAGILEEEELPGIAGERSRKEDVHFAEMFTQLTSYPCTSVSCGGGGWQNAGRQEGVK